MELPQPPISPLYCLLVATFPGLWWLGKLLAVKVSDSPPIRGILTFGLALVQWILSVHVFGLLTQSFGMGLVLGSVIPALIGYSYRNVSKSEKIVWPGWGLMAVALLGALYLVPTMIQTDIHDKQVVRVSHFAIFNNILNGFYPPRDLIFPDHSLRYHYGIDTMAAMVATLFRVRIDIAFDVVTFVGFALAILAFGGIGRVIFGPKGQMLCGFVCCFHGGFPWPYSVHNQQFESWLMGLGHAVLGRWITCPSTSTLFQMPWSAGYPLFGLALLISTQITPLHRNLYQSIALALTMCVTSFSNITVFLTVTGALLAHFLVLLLRAVVNPPRAAQALNLLPAPLGLACAMLIACGISGFSEIILKSGGSVILKAVGGITGSLYGNLQWNWGSFGILIPASLVGLMFMPNLKAFLIVHAGVSIYIANFYKYAHTWDIVKFAFVAEVSLALLSSAVIYKLWCGRWIGKSFALLLTLGIAAPAILFHIPYWRQTPPIAPAFDPITRGTWQILKGFQTSSQDMQAIAWLRPRVRADEVVLRRMPYSESYIFLGGLPVFQPDGHTIDFNNSAARIQRRRALELTPPTDIQAYLEEGVRWLVVDTEPGASDPLRSLAATWSEQGKAIQEASFNNIAVFRLLN